MVKKGLNKCFVFKYPVLTLLMLVLGFSCSCKVDVEDEYSYEKEMKLLADYIQANRISVAPTASGLYYIELKAGTGTAVKNGDNVTVRYTGKLLGGGIFDAGTFSFILGAGRVIKGWDEGISYMKRGGTAQLIIPSTLGYGSSGASTIPPYSSLIFDVELL